MGLKTECILFLSVCLTGWLRPPLCSPGVVVLLSVSLSRRTMTPLVPVRTPSRRRRLTSLN